MNTKGENSAAIVSLIPRIQEEFEHCETVFSALRFLSGQTPAVAAELLDKTQIHIANKLFYWMRAVVKNDQQMILQRPEFFGLTPVSLGDAINAYALIMDRLAAIEYPFLMQCYFEIGTDIMLHWHENPQN